MVLPRRMPSLYALALWVAAAVLASVFLPSNAAAQAGPTITIDGKFEDWNLRQAERTRSHVAGADSSRWSFTEPNPGTCAIDRWASDFQPDTSFRTDTINGVRVDYRFLQSATRHCMKINQTRIPTIDFLHSLERIARIVGGSGETVDFGYSCSLLDNGDRGAEIDRMACVDFTQTERCVTASCSIGPDGMIVIYDCDNTSATNCGGRRLFRTYRNNNIGLHNYDTGDSFGSGFSAFRVDHEDSSDIITFGGITVPRVDDENIEFRVPISALGINSGDQVCASMTAFDIDRNTLEPKFDAAADRVDDRSRTPKRVCATFRAPTPTPTATPQPTATRVPTATPQPTATRRPIPTATPQPTATRVPTATPRPIPTATATPQPTATRQPTATPQPTATRPLRARSTRHRTGW